MRKIIVPLIIGTLLFSVFRSEAVNHYIRADATGAGNGNSWTDAWTSLPKTFIRGDTYYFADGSYNGLTLSTPVSGTTYITIKKATVSDHGTDIGWDDSYGDGAASLNGTFSVTTSYWLIDGQARASWTNGYGFALTGPAGGGPGLLIGDNVKYVTVKYMSLTGHAATAAWSGGPAGDNAIWFNGTSSNITVSHCYAYSWGCCMVKTYTSTIESSLFEYNRFEWNRSSAAYHAEGVFPWGMNNTIWRNNVWIDIEGTGVIMLGDGGNNEIYGNLVYWSSAYPNPGQDGNYIGNGTFTTWTAYKTVNNKFYNNTIIVPNKGGIEFGISYPNTTSSGTARNNLYYCAAGNRNVYSSSINADYDIFYGLTHSSQANGVNGTGNPFVDSVNYDFRLKAHTVPGNNLGAAYNMDMNENIRTTWDRGAMEYGQPNPNPVLALSSTELRFGSVVTNTTLDLTVVVENTGSGQLTGSVTATSPYSIVSGGNYSLSAGQSQSVVIRYAPVATGNTTQILIFSGGGGATLAAIGSGIVAAANTPPSVSPIIQSMADTDRSAEGIQVYEGGAVQYSATASDVDGDPLNWQWLYSVNGGGETVVRSGEGAVGAVDFTYPVGSAGKSYLWKLRVSDGVATSEAELKVMVMAPVVADAGTIVEAESGVLTAPFRAADGSITQATTTELSSGGRAVYLFNVVEAGEYVIQAFVNAPDLTQNSFYLNIDADPVDPDMVWDILPPTSGFETRLVSWRGKGNAEENELTPKTFNLTQGLHQLILIGREANTQLDYFRIIKLQQPPQNLRVVSSK